MTTESVGKTGRRKCLPAPWIGPQLWERVSPRFTFTLTAWLGLLSIFPVWFKFRLPDKDEQADSNQ